MRRLPNKKERGQIIILMMFAIIPIFLLMATIFNGGYLVAQKTRLQNATDTSALMEASWTARSLNIMSMNNTAMTQAQAITSAGWAMEKPLMDAGLNSGLVAGFYVGRAFRIATMCPPWCTVLAPLIYGGLLAYLNDQVMGPLYEMQEELKRAMHTDKDTGFAKAATSFGRMNRILAEKFPDSIEDYSDTLLHVNFSDSASLIRYTAWADDPLNTGNSQIPVVEQSFRNALASLGIADNDSSTTAQELDQGTQSSISNAVAEIKDIRDVYNAGLTGTVTNPYSSIELNYFGNFRAQGYTDGEGPFNTGRGELETDYTELHTKLDGFIDGSQVGNAIGDAVSAVVPGGFIGDIIERIVRGVVNAIFQPLLGTAYDKTKTEDDANFGTRLDEVWEWSSIYSETHYSNSWRVDAQLDLGFFSIFAPPRAWRGLAPGIYHGQDLTNLADGVAFNEGDATAEANESRDQGIADYIRGCAVDPRVAIREFELATAKSLAKGTTWDGLNPKPANNNVSPRRPYTKGEYMELTSIEETAVRNQAQSEIEGECRTEYEAQHGGSQEPDVEGLPDDPAIEPGSEEEEYDDAEDSFASTYANGDSSQSQGSWNRPKPLQNYLLMLNWFFEPAYKVMALPFPADAALFAFIGDEFLGSDRSRPDPNWWCGLPFGEGFVCTNEAPLYAVNRQRILPQFAMNIADDLGVPLNSLPDAIQENYLADRDDWSVIVGAYAPTGLILAENGFGVLPTEMSTISQAEVYNSQWFDLFTQTWKAKLTPIALLDDDDHYSGLTGQWQQENVDMVEPLRAARHDNERVLNH